MFVSLVLKAVNYKEEEEEEEVHVEVINLLTEYQAIRLLVLH